MGRALCSCNSPALHERRRIVLTGGPGAGKTAVLEMARRAFCSHLLMLPEAASILFSGGFPRRAEPFARRAVQRAIFHVQTELERIAEEENAAVILCDRSRIDGLAYWPDPEATYFAELGTTIEAELARYHTVIHLRTPSAQGYSQNGVRTETATEAATIDERVAAVWKRHPRLMVVDATPDFVTKAGRALRLIRQTLPTCCRPGGPDNETP